MSEHTDRPHRRSVAVPHGRRPPVSGHAHAEAAREGLDRRQPLADRGFRRASGPDTRRRADDHERAFRLVRRGDASALDEGAVYSWSVRAGDGEHHSKWAGSCEFQVDSVAPEKPAVSSKDYPPGGFNGSPGRAGVFTFSPNASTDVVRYGWSLNVDTFANRVDANGVVDVQITPTESGTNVLYVRAYDKAGNASPPQTYDFLVRDESRRSRPGTSTSPAAPPRPTPPATATR
jgi:hypothetical protein